MNQSTSCPDAAAWQGHLRSMLPAHAQADLLAHLETCDFCQQTLETLAGENAWLLRTAEGIGQVPLPPSPALEKVLDTVKQLDAESNAVGDLHEGEFPAYEDALGFLLPPDRPGQLGRLGHYAIIAVLGRGGMGIVFKAFDEKLERLVAIKVLATSLAIHPKARKRFIREARAAAAVRNEHVIHIYAVEEASDPPYLVMEYVAARSLQDRFSGAPFECREIIRIGIETATGLAAAHAQGLIHRDVKPANLLVEDSNGRVKLTDFGLARALDDATLTQSGIVAGTPGYMAPEQARGETVDHRADLFSLGGVLYAMCTGRPAFRATGALATLKQVCESEPDPIPALNPHIPAALVAVIARLQAKDPGERFQSAAEVIAALEGCEDPARQAIRPSVAQHGRMQGRTLSAQRILATVVLLAVGGVLTAQIIIRIRDKDGNTTQITAPQGSSVTVEANGKTIDLKPSETVLLADGEIRRFLGHKGAVHSVAITRDGTRIVSASVDASARVWDTATGKEVVRFEGHASSVYSVAISADGRRVLSSSGASPGQVADKGSWSVCLWELESGKQLNRLDGQGDSITSAAFDADGRRALFAGFSGAVLLWDIENWREIKRFEETRGLWSVCFSPDGSQALVAGGHEDKPILRLRDLATLQEVMRFGRHDGGCWQAIFAPEGQRILSTGADRMVRLWDVKTGSVVQTFRAPDVTTGVALSADGKILVSGNYGIDKTVLVWNVETGQQLKAFGGHTNGVQSVAMTRDGRWAVSGSHDHTVRLWQLPITRKGDTSDSVK